MAITYVDTQEKLAKVISAIKQADAVGLDTEFSGVDVGAQSCAARAKVHVWSIAVPYLDNRIGPRGNRLARSAVLPASALEDPEIRAWLEDDTVKAVHNLPVDAHSIRTSGVRLRGGVNTLSLARWAWPERARGAGFTLDSLGGDFLGSGKTLSFKEIFTKMTTEYIIRTKRITYCECGTAPCRKRTTTPGHRRLERLEETRIPKEVPVEIPLESVGPGHERWQMLLEYAAQDAVLALGVYDLARHAMSRQSRTIPWL